MVAYIMGIELHFDRDIGDMFDSQSFYYTIIILETVCFSLDFRGYF